jgi:hypothetical protein
MVSAKVPEIELFVPIPLWKVNPPADPPDVAGFHIPNESGDPCELETAPLPPIEQVGPLQVPTEVFAEVAPAAKLTPWLPPPRPI